MKNIYILLFCCLSQTVFAQQSLDVETFRKLTTTDQRCDFLADSNMTKFDKPTYEAILSIIKAKKDDKAAFYWHFQYVRFAKQFKVYNAEQFPKIIEQMTEIAKRRGLEAESVIAQYFIAANDFGGNNLSEQQLYSAFLNCFERMKRLGFNKFQRYTLDGILRVIGCNFYALGDNEKALNCLLEAEKVTLAGTSINTHNYTIVLNTIEAIYADTKNYPQAIAYAEKIYDLNLNGKYNANQSWYGIFWQGLASLDMAQYLFEMGNYKEGEKYADRGYELYKAQEDLNNLEKVVAAFDALQVLIKIKLQLGKMDEVTSLFKKVEFLKTKIDFSQEANYFKPLRLYNNYYKHYEAKKDYTNAFRYMKLAGEMQDSLNRRNDKRKLWQIESRVKADSYISQIKSAEENSLLQERLRNVAIIALVFFAGIAFWVYRRIKKANNIVVEQKALLEQSLSEKENLLKEVHHRVKNNLQIISGLFEKQARKTDDDTTKKLMKQGQNRVFSIALVHQNLYQSDNLSTIEIKSYLEMLTKNIEKSNVSDNKEITLNINADDTIVDIDTAIPLGLIINELITNSYKYAFNGRDSGTIMIDFKKEDNSIFLNVKDDGIGLPKDFDLKKKNSLGMSLINGLVRQLDGSLDFQTSESGTIFNIRCAA